MFDKLNTLGIAYELAEHLAVYTIEEIDKLQIGNKDQIVKNLFLRDDKKKRFFIVTMEKDKGANLKALREKLNCRQLSFASETLLHTYLGLEKGAVSPFGILNDKTCTVEVVFDKDLLDFEKIGVHPNQNTATVWLKLSDLELVIRDHGNSVTYIEI